MFIVLNLTACDNPAANALCQKDHSNINAHTDGDSGPATIIVNGGQKIEITYLATFDSGSAQFKLLDSKDQVNWQQDIQKTAQTTVITIPLALGPATYNVILSTHDVVNSTICWNVSVR